MSEEHLGGCLWRIDGQYRIKEAASSFEQALPEDTELFAALKLASRHERALLDASQDEQKIEQWLTSEGTGSFSGEAWQTPSGKALVSALDIDPGSLTPGQQVRLTTDCFSAVPPKLSKAKQNSAEMKKIAKAIETAERLVSELNDLGTRPLYEVNPMDRSDPLIFAKEVEQSLIFRQREFVNIIGKLQPQGRLPEDMRNAYIAAATRIFLKWYDDGRPKDELGLLPTQGIHKAIPKTNTSGVYDGPVWSFLDSLFSEMLKAHSGDESLRDFFSISCNQSTAAKVVLQVRSEHP